MFMCFVLLLLALSWDRHWLLCSRTAHTQHTCTRDKWMAKIVLGKHFEFSKHLQIAFNWFQLHDVLLYFEFTNRFLNLSQFWFDAMTQPFTSANCERMTNKLRTKTHQLQPKANITTAATATEAATAAATAHTTNASIVCGRECVEFVCHPSARARWRWITDNLLVSIRWWTLQLMMRMMMIMTLLRLSVVYVSCGGSGNR